MTRPYVGARTERKPSVLLPEPVDQSVAFRGAGADASPLAGLAISSRARDLVDDAPNRNTGRPAYGSLPPGQITRLRRAAALRGSAGPAAAHITPTRSNTFAVIRRAGHKDAWTPTKDGRFIIKITSQAEADTYAQADLTGIQGVIPGRFGELLNHADIAQFDPVRTLRQPTSTERIIVIENLAPKVAELEAPATILDAKIGFITASQTQAGEEGELLPGFKSARHFVIDNVMFDSRQEGYRFEEGQEWIDMTKKFSRSGRYSDMKPSWLRPKAVVQMLDSVCRDLEVIHHSMVKASITFIGSSVLIVITPSDPGASKAKMIDFAHPIKASDETPERFEKYRKNYTLGLAGLIRSLIVLRDDLRDVRYIDEMSSATTAEELHDVL